MTDNNLIPPVTGNRSIPKTRSVPAKRDKHKPPPDRRTPENSQDKKDDGRLNIDEYA